MLDEKEQRILRKSFSDVARGYSEVMYRGKKLYIKHLSHHDHVSLEVLHKEFYDYGINEGLLSEKDALFNLEKEGIWTKEDERELDLLKAKIKQLVDAKKLCYLKEQVDNQNKSIKEEEEKFAGKFIQRVKLLGMTAEAFSEKKVNEYYIKESFYYDPEFKNKYLTEDLFDNLSDRSLQEIMGFYNEEIDVVGEKNIKKLAIQEFFQAYWSFANDNVCDFFGKRVCDLTYLQIKLASFARIFRNILNNNENIPEDIKQDPDKLLDYAKTVENTKEIVEKGSHGKGSQGDVVASTVFGAKGDDLKPLEGDKSVGTISLSEELKKKRAQGQNSLSMQDMMKLMGSS